MGESAKRQQYKKSNMLKSNNKKSNMQKSIGKKATVQFGQYLLNQDVSTSILGTLG